MATNRYNRCTESDLAEIMSICEDTVTAGSIMDDFCHDEMVKGEKPEVVVFPRTTTEISSIMRLASERGLPVTPRGAGTGLCGGAVPAHGGIVLCTSKMDRILEIDQDNATMTVEPGVLLMSIHEAAEKAGYLYAPDPGEKTATIGGNIATNAGGMRAIKYGVTRDSILGLEVVLPDGEIAFFGGKQMKNSTGYSLLNAVIGSEGTLCLVTKAVLKLVPLPKRTVSLLVPFDSLGEAVDAVPKIMSCGVLPQSVEFAERNVLLAVEEYMGRRFPHTTACAYLMIRLEGTSVEDCEHKMQIVAEACLRAGAQDALIAANREREKAIWEARAAFLAAIKSGNEADECDVVVPRCRIAELVEYSKEVSSEVGVRIESFGHAGDGNLHIYVLRDEMPPEEWNEKLAWAMDLLYKKGREMGGLVSGEHGIGSAKRGYMKEGLSRRELDLMAGLKATFDPLGILNPGKVI